MIPWRFVWPDEAPFLYIHEIPRVFIWIEAPIKYNLTPFALEFADSGSTPSLNLIFHMSHV